MISLYTLYTFISRILNYKFYNHWVDNKRVSATLMYSFVSQFIRNQTIYIYILETSIPTTRETYPFNIFIH